MESQPSRPDSPSPGEITRVLRRLQLKDADAPGTLYALIESELHGMARRAMSRERGNHTLQPTALVNDAFAKLLRRPDKKWEGSRHFFGTAVHVMNNILTDHERARRALRRARPRVPLDDVVERLQARSGDLLKFQEALEELETRDPRLAEVVLLRFCGSLTSKEIARAQKVDVRTVQRDLQVAKAFLASRINP